MESLNLDLAKFRDIHKGARAFVMANGPSLNKMDLSGLVNEIVFGANAGFLIYKHYSWKHKYFFCVDSRVVFDRLDELFQLALDNPDTVLFLPRSVNELQEDGSSAIRSVEGEIPEKLQNIVFFNMYPIGDSRVGAGLSENLVRGVTEPFTVTATMIEFAVYMGFAEIYLIGADTHYKVDSSVKQSGSMGPEGVKSLLVSTDDDTNHFDPSYFGQGRKWHAPNTGRMAAHYARIAELLPEDVRVFNAGVDSQLDVFPKCEFSSLLKPVKNIDEVKLIANYFAGVSKGLMIDVGACTGDSARHFLAKGWDVFCFEPDVQNRTVLEQALTPYREQLKIDPRAIGAIDEFSKPLYKSDISVGISGLLDFHDSHYVADRVDVVSMSSIFDEYRLEYLDFLKIDVEGFDLDVLRGFPWSKCHPSVITAEYEDRKTKKLGHLWWEIAEFLTGKGYAVYVSEWYPITEYGQRHSWRRLVKYPCKLLDPNGWGNLLAFLYDPGLDELLSINAKH